MSQTIETHRLAPTETKGTRFKATHEGNNMTATVHIDYGLNEDGNHARVAQELMEKLRWHGTMVGGSTRKGWVWVFTNQSPRIHNRVPERAN